MDLMAASRSARARLAERKLPDALELLLMAALVATVAVGFLAALGSDAPAMLHAILAAIAGH